MPSKTSTSHKKEWFSKAMFLQSYSSFAPIPIVYFMIVFMVLPMNIFMGDFSAMDNNQLYENLLYFPRVATSVGLPAAFLSGCMSAMLSFRYLHNNRSVNMVHSMPIRREALFVTQYIAGLSFVIIPNILILFITMLAFMYHGIFYFTPLILFFAIHCAAYFFFYSFGVLCSHMTGSIGGVPMFFLAFNFMALFVSTLLSPLFEIFYVGYNGDMMSDAWVNKLTPVISFAYACVIEGSYDIAGLDLMTMEEVHNYQITGDDIYYYMYDPATFWGLMVVAVLFVLASLWLYKIRHIESAGEAVAINWLKPVFRFLISVLGGLSLGVLSVAVIASSAGFTDEEMGNYIPVASLLWATVFAMVAEMILQKSFRVLKSWKKALLPVASVALIYGGMVADITGYETYSPTYEEIADVNLYTVAVYPRDSLNLDRLPVENGKITEDYYHYVNALHYAMLDGAREINDGQLIGTSAMIDAHSTTLYYQHQDGETTLRGYFYFMKEEEVETPDSLSNIVHTMANDPSLAEYCYDFPMLYAAEELDIWFTNLYEEGSDDERNTSTYALLRDMTSRQLEEINLELLQALEQDVAEGNIGEKYVSYTNQDFLEEGLFTWIEVEYAFSDYDLAEQYLPSNEIVDEKGKPTRNSRSLGGKKGFALTTKAEHTLAVIEKYDLLQDYTVLTNLERLELEQKWYLEERENIKSHWFADWYPDFDPHNVYSFAPVLTYSFTSN